MKIEIYREEDRLIVAGILVRNGYRVCQMKEKKTPNGKTVVYMLDAEKVKEAQNNE